MRCERYLDRLPEYAGGALDDVASAAVEAHLAACEACRAELREWTELRGALERAEAARGAVEVPAFAPTTNTTPTTTWSSSPVPAAVTESLPAPGPAPAHDPSTASLPAHAPTPALAPADPAGPPAIRPQPVDGPTRDPRIARWRRPATALRWRRARGPALGIAAAVALVFLARSLWPEQPVPNDPARSVDAPGAGGPTLAAHRPTGVPRAPTAIGRRAEPPASPADAGELEASARDAQGPVVASTRTPSSGGPSPVPAEVLATVSPAPPDGTSSPAATATAVLATPVPSSPPSDPPRDPPSDPPPSDPPTSAPPPTVPPSEPTPAPTTIAAGIVAGHVAGPDGLPRSEIWIVAERAAGAPDRIRTYSDVEGRFRLELDPGRWIVHARSAAHPLMWHPGRPSPHDAGVLDITAGASIDLAFHLETRPEGSIMGTITDAAGSPVDGALAVAAFPPAALGDAPRSAASALSGADGRFEIPVAPGVWLVGATSDPRGESMSWWGGGSPAAAERIVVRADASGPGPEIQLRLDP